MKMTNIRYFQESPYVGQHIHKGLSQLASVHNHINYKILEDQNFTKDQCICIYSNESNEQ